MKTSPSINEISKALLAAQKSMGSATKDAKNPFFKSKYADYGAVLEACKDELNTNKITILQPHINEGGVDFVETILLHESGEYISSQTKIEVSKKNDPQSLGSAITYARRYGLQSLVALPAEDDDGESQYNRQQPAVTKPAMKPVKKEIKNDF